MCPDLEFDPRWWTGPTHKITARLAQLPEDTNGLAILVTTGAFCPIHEGHIQMLETAKRELESRGMAVLGGYICPDHDRYVISKIRRGALSAAQRLELCELAVEDSDWLMVDRWAAIYASSFVMFTKIVRHIEKMVKAHVKTSKPIHIVYTFGGDNAQFAFHFTTRWSCVCVLRPGSLGAFNEMTAYDRLRENPRIVFCRDETAALDSTSIRRGKLSGLVPKVRDRWLAMQQAKAISFNTSGNQSTSSSREAIYIRNEGLWALRPFLKHPSCNNEELLTAYHAFCEGLQRVFESTISSFREPHSPRPTLRAVRLRDQEAELQRLLATNNDIISLDPCLPATHNLHTQQVFHPLEKEPFATIIVPGQDNPSSERSDISQAEQGPYTVLSEHLPLDPETSRLVEQRLPTSCTITHMSTANLTTPITANATNATTNATASTTPPATHQQKQPTILNARDFLLGTHHGGSLLHLPPLAPTTNPDDSSSPTTPLSSLARAPTLLPYIRPTHHIPPSIMPTADPELSFSRAVWGLNLAFFSAVGGGELVIGDVSGPESLPESEDEKGDGDGNAVNGSGLLFSGSGGEHGGDGRGGNPGFPRSMRLTALCEWHISAFGDMHFKDIDFV